MRESVRPDAISTNEPETPVPAEAEMVIYGADWCPDVAMARAYLARHGVAYVYRDIDQDSEAMSELLALRGKDWVVPTVVMADGTVLDNPSIRELANRLGRPRRKP
ncbi:MAG: NrdH-redoxin [Anaerolineae bacterium]|nr:NrdH-redoxin [Anaerolineae bacterium]